MQQIVNSMVAGTWFYSLGHSCGTSDSIFLQKIPLFDRWIINIASWDGKLSMSEGSKIHCVTMGMITEDLQALKLVSVKRKTSNGGYTTGSFSSVKMNNSKCQVPVRHI